MNGEQPRSVRKAALSPATSDLLSKILKSNPRWSRSGFIYFLFRDLALNIWITRWSNHRSTPHHGAWNITPRSPRMSNDENRYLATWLSDEELDDLYQVVPKEWSLATICDRAIEEFVASNYSPKWFL